MDGPTHRPHAMIRGPIRSHDRIVVVRRWPSKYPIGDPQNMVQLTPGSDVDTVGDRDRLTSDDPSSVSNGRAPS